MYKIGEWLRNKDNGDRLQVLEVFDTWGHIAYKVYNPLKNSIEFIGKDDLIEFAEGNIDENYVKYKIYLTKLLNETSQGFISSLTHGIIPLPHQLYVLKRALSDSKIRYVLADEVGLGKTIEAGLIIRELKARGLIKRILIVCPKGLVSQWDMEMKEKFEERFHVILPTDYETIKKITDKDDVYGQFDQVISPMDSIKPLERRAGWTEERIQQYNEERVYSIINSGWDLVIIDEAHRVAGSSSEVSRYKLGNMLSQSSPYMLLLTATPHSGKTEPFLRLLGLLDKEAFPNFKSLVKEQVTRYVIRTEKREAIDNKGNKLFKERMTKVIEVEWQEKHSNQKALYEKVTEYVKNGYNRAVKEKKQYIGFLMVLMQRLATSSTAAIKDSMVRRIEILENQQSKVHSLTFDDLVESDFEENMDEALEVVSLNLKKELVDLKEILEIAKQAEYQSLDAKAEILLDHIDKIFEADAAMKVIVFTEFVETQKYLRLFLHTKGYSISILNGSMDIEQRNEVLKEFKEATNILISTDAGGEGLNLQFSNIVINYDLPWNPMKIEQRIGRVDRIGQKRDVVIYNFVNSGTVENRVRAILEEKLETILEETGVNKMSDVLDNEIAEMDFTEVYIQSIQNPKFIEHHANKLEADLKEQIKFQNQYKDIMREEKDLQEQIYTDNYFDLESTLEKIISYYSKWKNQKQDYRKLSLKDPIIAGHLRSDIQWCEMDKVPIISIKDFPNEDGYFSLWELSINNEMQYRQFIPVFVTKSMVLRPMSGKRIWDELFKNTMNIAVEGSDYIENEIFEKIKEISQKLSFDVFMGMKTKYESKIEDDFRKYKYAIEIRKEAAIKIGIDNIRNSKLKSLDIEQRKIQKEYEKRKKVIPVLKPVFMAELVK
ncbi:SNF2 family N-terminal domain-containing protein [Anaerovirgula multivorans]|uniref:SNF2 family N-terminal domain-containing protein n=1 Tax=Anaerovirgula multivorans TaxID=312168 RepID=A0A239KVR0_9FIRM|nr:helicase-related protein [Anaerovirgula multivorans]SNT21703.1 SNF2 family N-terminal domain-containing protein [Anaerovirgula multivorans]